MVGKTGSPNAAARRRIAINCVRAALIFLSFAYFFTGNVAHEWIGLVAVLVLVEHNAHYLRWWKKPLAGTLNFRKMTTFLLNAALAVALIAVAVSGVMLSSAIFPFVPSGGGLFARELHTAGAAWLFVLSAAHAGLHTKLLSGALKNVFARGNAKKTSPNAVGGKIFRVVAAVVLCGVSVFGVFAFVRRQFWGKLTAESSFDMFAYDDSLPRFFADYFSVAVLFFIAGTLIEKFLFRSAGTQKKGR